MFRLYSYYTICEEKYEITAVIINVWGYTEILPQNLSKSDDYLEITEIMHQLKFN